MKAIGGTQKAVRANTWRACAVILAVGAAAPALRALPQTALIGDEESKIATRIEIPFKLYGDYTIVARGSVGDRHKLHFLIDTGSSSTVVDGYLARTLRLARS